LKNLRERAGMTPAQAAQELNAHPATVRRIELAQTSLDEGQVQTLLRAYGAGDTEIKEFLGKLAIANLPGWWHPWRSAMAAWQLRLMSVESAASLIRTWDPGLVPALLRTPAYARAVDDVLRPDLSTAVKNQRIELLVERQRRLQEQQTRIWAVTTMSALLTHVGSPEIMAEQRKFLLKSVRTRADVILQIHPLNGPLHELVGIPALTYYRVSVPEIPDHVVREGGLADTADVWDHSDTVTFYRILLDHSCVRAPHPHLSKEALK
jgi:transcriptional regulator with XRE-family HTH domain